MTAIVVALLLIAIAVVAYFALARRRTEVLPESAEIERFKELDRRDFRL
jgi:hypothetical protein